MYKMVGVILFLLGGTGLLLYQYNRTQERSLFLQEMNQSLLRLHQSISKQGLPVLVALRREMQSCDQRLQHYYEGIEKRLQKKETSGVLDLFEEELTKEIKELTKEEERRLWVQALCSLFLVECPGEDAEFYAYYEGYAEMVRGDFNTKKERQKVTACTTAMGLLTLLLLLM